MKEVFYRNQPQPFIEGLDQSKVYDFSYKQAKKRHLNLSVSMYQKKGTIVNKAFRQVLKDEAHKIFIDKRYQYRFKDGKIFKVVV